MYSFTYNNRTIRRFKCKDCIFRVIAKDVGDAIGNNNITRDLGCHGTKAVVIVKESVLPSLSLNERAAMLITFEETVNYLDTRRKNKALSIPLKQYLTEHWNDGVEETMAHETQSMEIVSSENTIQYIINTKERLLSIDEHNIPFAYDECGRVAFRAIDVCLFLEYTNTKQAVLQHTTKEMRVDIVFDRPSLESSSLKSNNDKSGLESSTIKSSSENRLILHGDGYNGIWILEPGLYALIFGSHKPMAAKFKEWIFWTVLPALRQAGMLPCPCPMLNDVMPSQQLKIEPPVPLDIDISMFPVITLGCYDHVKVLYLLYLRKYGALKFGISDNINVRIQQHCRLLGDRDGDVKLVYIEATKHNAIIETTLKQCVIMNGWKRDDIVVNGSLQNEIIDLQKTTIQNIINLIKQFVSEHSTQIKNKEQKIMQKSLEIEKLRLENNVTIQKLELELKNIAADLESKHIAADLESKHIAADLESKRIAADLESKRIDLELRRLDVQFIMIESKRQRHSNDNNKK
jgi:prophage antirepressor-like protein/predicted GIY-YIG superfamily endonuclease